MDFVVRVQQDEAERPAFEQAVVTWADYLYERSDFRAAADAYAMILTKAPGASDQRKWAEFQRANALLQVADYRGSINLFDSGCRVRESVGRRSRRESRLRPHPNRNCEGKPSPPAPEEG